MRLDCQILLKSPPQNLLAGSAPAVDKAAGIFTKRIWQPYLGLLCKIVYSGSLNHLLQCFCQE